MLENQIDSIPHQVLSANKLTWNKDTQSFLLVPRTPATATKPHTVLSRGWLRHVSSDVAEKHLAWFCRHDFTAQSENEFVQIRTNILEYVVANEEIACKWLARLLIQWRVTLKRKYDKQRVLSRDLLSCYCEEYIELAKTHLLVGDVVSSRQALGICIPSAQTSLQPQYDEENDQFTSSRTIVRRAKTVLFQCVRFQELAQQCYITLGRRGDSPRPILTQLLRDLDILLTQAPYSIAFLEMKCKALTLVHQFQVIIDTLKTEHVRIRSPRLVLIYVRALEIQGYYNESIEAASSFLCNAGLHIRSSDADALERHCTQLNELLVLKAKAEEAMFQSQFSNAEQLFNACLKKIEEHVANGMNNSAKLYATLLCGHATTLAALGNTTEAISEFKQVLNLDPRQYHSVARIRLQTLELHAEIINIHASMNKDNKDDINRSGKESERLQYAA